MKCALIAVLCIPLAFVGCKSTGQSAAPTQTAATAQSLPLTGENRENLLGYWEGKWVVDGGASSNNFELAIKEIDAAGTVEGSRLYQTNWGSSAQPTVGQVGTDVLVLDTEKGKDNSITLRLEEDSGGLILRGRYIVQGRNDEVFTGTVWAKKVRDY